MKCSECSLEKGSGIKCQKQLLCFDCNLKVLGKYGLMEHQRKDIEDRYAYHAPTTEQVARYDTLRTAVAGLALIIVSNTPTSREQDKALDLLDMVMMMANAAIARNEHKRGSDPVGVIPMAQNQVKVGDSDGQ